MNDPIKCSECGTWWRGEEHRCAVTLPEIDTKEYKPKNEKPKDQKLRKGCPQCGATGVHYCQGKRYDYAYKCYRCGDMHDYRYTHHCQDKKNDGKNKDWYKY